MNYNRKKRNIDYEKKQVFHGAFTGGFSAGYFNTVGSKEGWRPNENKKNNVDAYMDDDDYNDWGGPKDVLKSFSVRKEATTKTASDDIKESSLNISTIGNELLRRLGWRQSTQNAYIILQDGINSEQNDDDEDDDDKVQRIPLPSPMDIPIVKLDTFGLGYVDPSLKNTTSLTLLQNPNTHTYHNEDGENIYYDEENVQNGSVSTPTKVQKPNMENYNFEIVDTDDSSIEDNNNFNNKNAMNVNISKQLIRNGLNQWSQIPSSKKIDNSKDNDVSGFIISTTKSTSNDYKRWPGPNIPTDYEPQVQKFTPQKQPSSYTSSVKNYSRQRHHIVPPPTSKQPLNHSLNNARNSVVFTSLVESMNRRFTKSSQNENALNDDKIQNQPPESSNSLKPSKVCTRTVQTWIPNSLLCKRFSINGPLTSNHTTKHPIAATNKTKEWSDEAHYFEQSILPTINTKSANINQYKNDKQDDIKLEEPTWQYNINERPSMELKKRIYNHVIIPPIRPKLIASVKTNDEQNKEKHMIENNPREQKSHANIIPNNSQLTKYNEDLRGKSNTDIISIPKTSKSIGITDSTYDVERSDDKSRTKKDRKRQYRRKYSFSSSSNFSSDDSLSSSSDERKQRKRRKDRSKRKAEKKRHKKRKHRSKDNTKRDYSNEEYYRKKRQSTKKSKKKERH